MGNKYSKELEDTDNSLLSFEDDLTDYNGIKTSEEKLKDNYTISQDDEENSNTFSENNILDINKNDINKIPVTFEWESGGNAVYLTGSFCNWKQFFLMKKNKYGKHSLTLYLNKGFIQYKFKIDDEWKCNEKYPIFTDNGNKNNYIDTTNWEISAENTEETSNSTEVSFRQNEIKSFISNIEFTNSQNNYSNYIPKKNEMNDTGIKIPEQYKNKFSFDININKNKFAVNKYLSLEEKNMLGDNYAYKSINPVINGQINHINHKKDENKTIICSIVTRHRLKFTTFVYYKSK